MLALVSDTGIIVLVIAIVLLFGASQLPKMARNLAEAGKEFRKVRSEIDHDTLSTQVASVRSSASQDDVTISRADFERLVAGREKTSEV